MICRCRLMPMVGLLLLLILMLALPGCALDKFTPPPVSPELIAHARSDRADAQTLSHGRALFVSRCLECHTLPSVTKHSPNDWPHFVSRMSGRARLTASERDAIIAYLRAASATR
jgi:mono/diheme cytochrome c family protein